MATKPLSLMGRSFRTPHLTQSTRGKSGEFQQIRQDLEYLALMHEGGVAAPFIERFEESEFDHVGANTGLLVEGRGFIHPDWEQARTTIEPAGADNGIEWIAVQPGTAGNALRLMYVAGVGALDVAYAAGVVTVTLAVGGSTPNAIIAALAASATSAFDHVMARNVFGSTGAGAVTLAVAATNLAGGRGTALRRASLTIDPAGANNGLVYTARRPGVQGEAISVAYTVGLGAVLPIVTVTAQAISIQIGAGVSTANDVLRALETSDQARQLVEVRHVYGSTGAGTLPGAVAAASLANGVDGSAVRFIAGGLAGTISSITDQTMVLTVPALTESAADELAMVELDVCGHLFQFQCLVI